MRIIAGEKRGARLLAPKGDTTRPTLDRVRESLFMVLSDRLEGARSLDLFAGSGSLGLEALSRGAAFADFVEIAQAPLETLRANILKLGMAKRARVIRADALKFLTRLRSAAGASAPYDLILIDPPYGQGWAHEAMKLLALAPIDWLAPDACVVVQTGRRDVMQPRYGPLAVESVREYGETRIHFYHFAEGRGEPCVLSST